MSQLPEDITSPLVAKHTSRLVSRLDQVTNPEIDPGENVHNRILAGDQAAGNRILAGDLAVGVRLLAGDA